MEEVFGANPNEGSDDQGSFNGRTLDFGSGYAGSIPAPCTNFLSRQKVRPRRK